MEKNEIIASTKGNVSIPEKEDIKIGRNCLQESILKVAISDAA